MNCLQINQVIIHLKIKNISEIGEFDYTNYKNYYHKDIPKNRKKISQTKTDNYVARKTIDFTYIISRKLAIHLFITKNFEYWCSFEGFNLLLTNLVYDLEKYIVNLSLVEFDYKITNILTSFPIRDQELSFLRTSKLIILENYLNEFNNFKKIYPGPLKLLVQGETENYTLNLKKNGTLKIFAHQQRASIICESIDLIVKLERFFIDFCDYYQNIS